MANKSLQGKVVSDKNDKTIVVWVEAQKKHPAYRKYQKIGRKYHVHDPDNTYKVGDLVEFNSTRPISKMKRWSVCPCAPCEGAGCKEACHKSCAPSEVAQ